MSLGRGEAAELLGQLLGHPGDPGLELLHRPRRSHHPPGVAEPPPQLATDAGHDVAEEVGGQGGVVAADRLDQGEVGHLAQVVGVDASTVVAAGLLGGHHEVETDDLVLEVAAYLRRVVEAGEQGAGELHPAGTGEATVPRGRG